MNKVDGWRQEMQAAFLYRVAADCEAATPRAALFRELATEAGKQAGIWARLAGAAGEQVPPCYTPDLRTRVAAALTRRFGVRPMRGVLAAMKVRGMSLYNTPLPAPGTDSSNGNHSNYGGSVEAERRQRHRAMGAGGSLRAAVFGVNDGLISNASLIMGIAGAHADSGMIVLSGAAGLVAGAFSMAAGEYVSVRSQREMFEYQIGLERDELMQYPAEEAEELALIYQARGIARDDARRLAAQLTADPVRGLDVLAREELGLNPDDLGSPWGAALSSFLSFAAGALIPLLPFLLVRGTSTPEPAVALALALAVGLSLATLLGVGAALSLFTGRNAWWSAMRMLGIGLAAGAITYGIGRLLGVSLS